MGANRLPAARRRPILAEFGSQFANMFAVVLMVAAGITFLAYAPQHSHGMRPTLSWRSGSSAWSC